MRGTPGIRNKGLVANAMFALQSKITDIDAIAETIKAVMANIK